MSTRMAWTPQVHEDILVAFVTASKLSTSQLSDVMKVLAAQGYTFTESALKCVSLSGSGLFLLNICYFLCNFDSLSVFAFALTAF